MRTLHGPEAVAYLESLKRYELEQARKRPIGERVKYYNAQVPGILAELKRARACHRMCSDCVTDCPGTTNTIYSGCVFKTRR